MANVYSTKFLSLPGFSGGPSTPYVVPDGYLAVVKCVSIVWGDVIASGIDAWVQTGDLAKISRYTWAFGASTPTNYGGVQVTWGMWPVEAGDTLAGQTASGTCDIVASGYLLALP